ncbi:SH3 domain-containing protein [Pseudoalteromonas sp. BZK2]|uniref:SH3 domain-containing protein n=1 Tax=Pseudoalteromonas sp. BZK2 TaxID=1904458 RepID=UPI001654A347|nr:SH3 domain-containing protein [Pseudoalteromonas sp. BZK2]MBC7008912.1 SH3 domain-containing protein [Pseudoalteromonas sp. BZK2]
MRRSIIALSITLGVAFSAPMHAEGWQSDVIGVTQSQLSPSYWLAQGASTKVIMTEAQIAAFNEKLVKNNKYIVDPLSFQKSLTKDELTSAIYSTSSIPKSPRFFTDGRQLTAKDFAKYQENLNLNKVRDNNEVRFAVVVKRTALRTFPTWDRVLNSGLDQDLDRFQESGMFPGEAVAVLHQSADKKWLLVRAYNYLAWTPAEDLAFADADKIKAYREQANFLVVTGAKVNTAYVPSDETLSEVQLDMGVRLPLVDSEQVPYLLNGQNSYASHVVQLPTRDEQGKLVIKPAMISKTADVNLGYLDYNEQNLIKQGFKFLGERYGWGHDYNGRDCTGFVGEIYKSFGLLMPRNSGQQGSSEYGQNSRFDKNTAADDKLPTVKNMAIGDLIYIPGHVMMYLGEHHGEPYVIHDVKGLGYNKGDGSFYSSALNGVSVTPLLPLRLSQETSYLDRVYNIKRIR